MLAGPGSRWTARLLVLSVGAWSLTAQTILLREMLVSIQGSELGTGIFLGSWLLWVMIGAVWEHGRPRHPAPLRFQWLVLLAALGLLLQIAGWLCLRTLAWVPPAHVFPLGRLAWWGLVLCAPTPFLTGLLFARVARARDDPGLYAWEAAGCFLGGTLFTLLLPLGIPPLAILGSIGLPLVLAAWAEERRIIPALLGLPLIMGLCLWGNDLERMLIARQSRNLLPDATLLETTDAPTGRLSIAERSEQRILLVDGQVSTDWSTVDEGAGKDAILEAALLMAESSARRAVVVGDPSRGLCQAMLEYPTIEAMEQWPGDQAAARFISSFLPSQRQSLDTRWQERLGDPRTLILSMPPASLDLIVLDIPNPTTAANSRLYSREFFEDAARALDSGGILATRIVAGANYMGPELEALGGSVLQTLEAVFPEVVVLPGDPARFLATSTMGRLSVNPTELASRHDSLGGPVLHAEIFESLVDTARLDLVRKSFSNPDPTSASLIDTDDRPTSFLLGMLVQARLAGSQGSRVLQGLRGAGLGPWLLSLLIIGVLRGYRVLSAPLSHRDGAWLAWWAMAAAGFTSLSLAVILLFAFQAHVGTLFGQVGLLNAVLLAGTALGAGLGNRLTRGIEPASHGIPWTLMGVLCLLLLFSILLPALLAHVACSARFPLLALALVAGFLSGAAFPAAARLAPSTGLLFAADHLGGALGAALVGVFVVPIVGTRGACALLVLVQAIVMSLVGLHVLNTFSPRRLLRWQRAVALRPGLPWPRLALVLTGLTLMALGLGGQVDAHLAIPHRTLDAVELSRLGEGRAWTRENTPYPYYKAKDGTGGTTAVAAASMAVRPDIQGYGGPLDLVLVVDAEGRIDHLQVRSSQETPEYLEKVIPWLSSLPGTSILDGPFMKEDGGEVDAVSGATVTSRAIVETAREVGRSVAAHGLDLPIPQTTVHRRSWTRGEIHLLIAIPLGLLVFYKGGARLRGAFLLAMLGIGGIWLNTQISLESLSGLLRGHLPTWGSPLFLQMTGLAALTLALGSVWCGMFCPFGAAMDLLGRLGLRLKVSAVADRRARSLKYLVLAVLLTAFALSGDRSWLSVDPLAAAFSGWPQGDGLAIMVLLMVGTLLFYRAWCRYLCPLGALLSLADRHAILRRFRPRRSYDRCDLGVRGPQDMDCIQCNRCQEAQTGYRGSFPGPVQPSCAGGQSARKAPSFLLPLLLLLTLGLMAWHGSRSHASLPGGDDPQARSADLPAILKAIQAARLSGHDAEFWHPLP